LPAGAPANQIGVSILVQNPTWNWLESPWVMLVAGQWTEIRWTNAPLTNVAALGVQVGGSSVSYNNGYLLLDQLAVVPTFGNPSGSAVFVPDRTGPPTSGGTCSPRPEVGVAVTPLADGSLQVTVSARAGAGTPGNAIQALRFGRGTNALIDAGGQTGSTGNFTVTPPAGTQQTTFTVRRATAGQGFTVPLTVVDGCGDWPTFVGRGAS
jgi:hypothetical protein